MQSATTLFDHQMGVGVICFSYRAGSQVGEEPCVRRDRIRPVSARLAHMLATDHAFIFINWNHQRSASRLVPSVTFVGPPQPVASLSWSWPGRVFAMCKPRGSAASVQHDQNKKWSWWGIMI